MFYPSKADIPNSTLREPDSHFNSPLSSPRLKVAETLVKGCANVLVADHRKFGLVLSVQMSYGVIP
jgi:hypothetical protein